ncbi:TPA: ead/Ea22-like family protein [Escherichia coli]|nr:ead/Ea22-like family protein [Escherichia coli]
MSKIDYQKLREIAEKTKIAGEAPVMPFDQRINALNDFMKHFSPDIALALLDELERNQQYIKLRDQENEDIALTVGKLRVELEGKDSKIANLTAERDALREGEMGDARHSNTRAAADIYFQLVEECEIPAGGSLVEYVDDMREKLEAAENNLIDSECHVAELEEALRDKQALLEASEKRNAKLQSENAYIRNRFKELDLLMGKNILVMQAAIIEWQATGDAKSGLAWIYNTLFGPGELPDESEKDAQAYFNRKYAPIDEKLMALHKWFWEQSEAERAAGIRIKGGE